MVLGSWVPLPWLLHLCGHCPYLPQGRCCNFHHLNRSNPHWTPAQIRTQILWCCQHVVWMWTLPFMHTGSICLRFAQFALGLKECCWKCVNIKMRTNLGHFSSENENPEVTSVLFSSLWNPGITNLVLSVRIVACELCLGVSIQGSPSQGRKPRIF